MYNLCLVLYSITINNDKGDTVYKEYINDVEPGFIIATVDELPENLADGLDTLTQAEIDRIEWSRVIVIAQAGLSLAAAIVIVCGLAV